MGFVIAFPGNSAKRKPSINKDRQKQADITIFPGVRYERYATEAPKRARPKPQRIFIDPITQPG